MIEGVGRAKTDGKVSLQALGVISFDDETGTYQMRAFNDGRWLETEVKWPMAATLFLGALHLAHSRPSPCCASMKRVNGPSMET